ncbi:MAG: hypothetical protein AB7O57_00480 [Hyphomicrobiaceae bacterium]
MQRSNSSSPGATAGARSRVRPRPARTPRLALGVGAALVLLAAGGASFGLVLGRAGPFAGLVDGGAVRIGSEDTGNPDEVLALYLARSTLMALDDANRTGNYAVFRELASPSFQSTNSVERLAGIFSVHRQRDIELSVAALRPPDWSAPPSIGADRRLRLAGRYGTAAGEVDFAMVFEAAGGAWRLFEIGVGVTPESVMPPRSVALR